MFYEHLEIEMLWLNNTPIKGIKQIMEKSLHGLNYKGSSVDREKFSLCPPDNSDIQRFKNKFEKSKFILNKLNMII